MINKGDYYNDMHAPDGRRIPALRANRVCLRQSRCRAGPSPCPVPVVLSGLFSSEVKTLCGIRAFSVERERRRACSDTHQTIDEPGHVFSTSSGIWVISIPQQWSDCDSLWLLASRPAFTTPMFAQ